jgi:hypothetical protein
MARDTRVTRTGGDRNKYYKGEYINKNKLTRAVECQGVFYSTDEQGIKSSLVVNNGVSHTLRTVNLVTKDYIPDLAENDFVLYNDEYWLVTAVNREDINNESRPYARHAVGYVVSMKI